MENRSSSIETQNMNTIVKEILDELLTTIDNKEDHKSIIKIKLIFQKKKVEDYSAKRMIVKLN